MFQTVVKHGVVTPLVIGDLLSMSQGSTLGVVIFYLKVNYRCSDHSSRSSIDMSFGTIIVTMVQCDNCSEVDFLSPDNFTSNQIDVDSSAHF